ncbi:hypothetical protein SELMODRAFT_442403 [Selaginella moellendorffii]|uniref:Pre-mRNA-splicing factor SYF2 n=1 Tax=Selaginella moellendorffii TaxID=88036 RepID=D8RT51_SELML|nr:pre-mRNA-splicing factor syf2 [Selaginella moellendorffii]XP_024534931.1 pre-mRNA-splicing factor syf2 [Selaginella moellendorffii]EFJ24446.1 hypothetical protein SELMODRAFT_442403 [Selaginella moellendorffii]|eukprot:XP_002974224.1 pre-mRNA-splicing factor syf2 [Selaginella moellendorffii]
MEKESRVHPACINASNPYHECSQYCFRKIAEARATVTEELPNAGPVEDEKEQAPEVEEEKEAPVPVPPLIEDESGLDERQKKLRLLQRKMDEARKKNEQAMMAERKKQDAPKEERGVSKQKWFEEKQKQAGKRLEFSGIDKSKMYMLDTQEAAEEKYKKRDKNPAPFGWDVFNQKSLYNAYKKRAKTIPNTVEEYTKVRDNDPDFYCNETSLQYGKTPAVPEEFVDRMVQELEGRISKRKDFSRRRKYHEEKDIDSINERNEHFNRKIERAFGKYTVEIKNNLERGTALPD